MNDVNWITETGRVGRIDADCLWVETIQKSTCDTCAAEKGCGQSLIVRWGAKEGHVVEQAGLIRVLLDGRRGDDYSVGDQVCIGVPDDVVAKGSLFVYLTPLLGLMLSVLCADYFTGDELQVALSGMVGFCLGACVVRVHSYLNRNDVRVQPVLIDDVAPLSWG